MKFLSGDKVRILGKSRNCLLRETEIEIGDIVIVSGTYGGYFTVSTNDSRSVNFNYKDAELVEDNEDAKPVEGVKKVKFKVGDKVMSLDKNRESSFGIKHFNFNYEDATVEPVERIKYKQLKVINGIEIEKARGNTDCPEFDKEFIVYLKTYGYTLAVELEDLLSNAPPLWIEFLIEHKFIEEEKPEFKSFDLNIKIDTVDELLALWHRLNMPLHDFNEAYRQTSSNHYGNYPPYNKNTMRASAIWNQINDVVTEKGLRKK